jgi:hypothetical protein
MAKHSFGNGMPWRCIFREASPLPARLLVR